VGVEGVFKWCYPDRLAEFQEPPLLPWSVDEPNNWKGRENCLELYAGLDPIMINDNYCNRNRSYICEVTKDKNLETRLGPS